MSTTQSDTTPKTSTHEIPNRQATQLSKDDSGLNTPFYSSTTIPLRASIAAISETRLRQIVVRLVEQSPSFQYAVAKELHAATPSAVHLRPSSRRQPRSKRKPARRGDTAPDKEQWLCVNCGLCPEGDNDDSLCVYHPGKLEEDIYEFLSHTPEGVPFQIRRTITMWSCCDEDVCSPGCVTAPAHACIRKGLPHTMGAQPSDETSHSAIVPPAGGGRPVESIRD